MGERAIKITIGTKLKGDTVERVFPISWRLTNFNQTAIKIMPMKVFMTIFIKVFLDINIKVQS